MLGAGSGALASELFADDDHVHVLDKAGVYTDVFGSDAPVLLGAFSDDAEECPGCGPLSKEFSRAAKALAGYGIKTAAVDCTNAMPKCHGLTTSCLRHGGPQQTVSRRGRSR